MKSVKLILVGLVFVVTLGSLLAFKALDKNDVLLWTSTIPNQCRYVTGVIVTGFPTIPNQPTVYYTLTGPPTPVVTTTCTLTAYTKTTVN